MARLVRLAHYGWHFGMEIIVMRIITIWKNNTAVVRRMALPSEPRRGVIVSILLVIILGVVSIILEGRWRMFAVLAIIQA